MGLDVARAWPESPETMGLGVKETTQSAKEAGQPTWLGLGLRAKVSVRARARARAGAMG